MSHITPFELKLIECLIFLVMLAVLQPWLIGTVVIRAAEVGIVVKKMSLRSLAPGHLMALNGEAGYQADTLAPGVHFWLRRWQYRIIKAPVTVIPQGEIALVIAADGGSVPPDRILGKVVPCDNFQDARKFLTSGGEKGRQIAILTAGTYRINTVLFTVVQTATAKYHGMDENHLKVRQIDSDKVGIVTTLDGASIEAGEIAGPVIVGHDSYQAPQAFIDKSGRRGLQEQILLSGSWNINPWFANVHEVDMVMVPIGHVGVVVSYVGKPHEDVSGEDFKHGDLVNVGHKGVWTVPLYPGKHPINTAIASVEIVPTTNIVLNWADRTEAHEYDEELSSITVRSKDGFAFNLDVAQIIHVGALDAPKVISRVGSMQNLVDHVLQPIVGNYFRNSAQDNTVLDFLNARTTRQSEAAAHIRAALQAYDVQAIDTLIGDIHPPAELMHTQTDRKIAEEQKKTFEVQELAQIQRQQLVRQTSLADIQQKVVGAEQGVNIAELEANASIKQAQGNSESIRLRATGEAEGIKALGNAKAEAYRAGVEALGGQAYTSIQLLQIVGDGHVKIVPDVSVTGGTESRGLVDALVGGLVKKQSAG